MHTWPASSFTEATGSLPMHCHYDSSSLSVSLQKFQGKSLFFFLPDTSCIQPFISNPTIRWFYLQVEFISWHCSQESRESCTSFPNFFVFVSNSIILLYFSLPQANTRRGKKKKTKAKKPQTDVMAGLWNNNIAFSLRLNKTDSSRKEWGIKVMGELKHPW